MIVAGIKYFWSYDAYTNQLHGYTGLVSRAIHLACEDNFTSTLSLNAEGLSSHLFYCDCVCIVDTVSDDYILSSTNLVSGYMSHYCFC